MKNYEKYRIKIERAKEREGIPSRGGETHNGWRICHQQCRCCISVENMKRTGTSGSRKFVDGAPWFINEKFDPVVTERPALISSENPAWNSKNSNSTSTRSPSRENCQTAILSSSPSTSPRFRAHPPPSSSHHPIPIIPKRRVPPLFSTTFLERRATKNFIKILTNFWGISLQALPIHLRHHVPILRNFPMRCEIFLES